MPDLSVHAVGEVDRAGAGGEVDHVAIGREDEDLVVEQVHLEEFEELVALREVGLKLDDLAEEGDLVVGADGALSLLVAPVGGDAVLRHAVHIPGADLDLQRLLVGPDDLRVERLVLV